MEFFLSYITNRTNRSSRNLIRIMIVKQNFIIYHLVIEILFWVIQKLMRSSKKKEWKNILLEWKKKRICILVCCFIDSPRPSAERLFGLMKKKQIVKYRKKDLCKKNHIMHWQFSVKSQNKSIYNFYWWSYEMPDCIY